MNEHNRDIMILGKIRTYCTEIEKTHLAFHSDKELFFDKENGFIYRNSVTMPILQIGELVKNLSDEFKSAHIGIPWKAMAGMRDVFAHNYGSIDYEMTWNTSIDDIADLKSYIETIIAED